MVLVSVLCRYLIKPRVEAPGCSLCGPGSQRQAGVQQMSSGVTCLCSFVTWLHCTSPPRESVPAPSTEQCHWWERNHDTHVMKDTSKWLLRGVSEWGAKPSSPSSEVVLLAQIQLSWYWRKAGFLPTCEIICWKNILSYPKRTECVLIWNPGC